MSRPKLAVHGHFYQPERRDPFSGEIAPQPAAAPYRDWNARIDAECYKPNAERGNLRHISYDLGPTLASWLTAHDPSTHKGFVDSDLSPATDGPDCGNAMAQAYNHAILPLASLADRRTEIRWGLRDFELRFDRRPTGIWLPETAVDLPTLRILAAEGVHYTILAPWQAVDTRLDTRRPYRVELGNRQSIVVVFYDAGLSASASFESDATMNADSFARERILPRLSGPSFADGTPRVAVIATDGELYGHHQKFRDLFLARLVNPGLDAPDRGFDITTVGRVVGGTPASVFPAAQIAERTSWSCHHGVLRWYGECPDAADGRWKGPLRAALERLASAIDTVAGGLAGDFMDPAELWSARDQYVDVVFGAETAESFARRCLPIATDEQRAGFLALMEAERWRLAMFASDGWFWGDPIRPETKQVLLCAARAVRSIDGLAGTDLKRRLVDDLSLFVSPSRRIDGAAIYAEALAEAGQPAVPARPKRVTWRHTASEDPMKVSLAVVCDYAEVRENLLTLVAAGITRLRRDSLPAPLAVFVALQLEVPAAERPFPHEVSARVIGPSGTELATIGGGFQVASTSDFEADESGVVSLPFDLRMVSATEYGWYSIEITIDGANRQILRIKVTRPPASATPVEAIRIAIPDLKRH